MYHEQASEHLSTVPWLAVVAETFDGSEFEPTDRWDSPIRYERMSSHKSSLSSNGPDRTAGTYDDTRLTKVIGSDFVVEKAGSER